MVDVVLLDQFQDSGIGRSEMGEWLVNLKKTDFDGILDAFVEFLDEWTHILNTGDVFQHLFGLGEGLRGFEGLGLRYH
jgi:hypothetical protein